MTAEDKKKHFFESHMRDLYHRASQKNYPVFTDFLTTGEYITLKGMFHQKKDGSDLVSIVFYGGFEDCSRLMAGFIPLDYQSYGMSLFPIQCIRIEISGYRYDKPKLTHGDFLGSILGLGIERSVIGDIRICESYAYVFCREEIAELILQEFHYVRHSAVECQQVCDVRDIPAQEYEMSCSTVSSLRLDNVVSAMIGSSRYKVVERIRQGNVVVDSTTRDSVSYPCRDGNIISVRHHGKYRLQISEDAITRKGKIRIQIYKYK